MPDSPKPRIDVQPPVTDISDTRLDRVLATIGIRSMKRVDAIADEHEHMVELNRLVVARRGLRASLHLARQLMADPEPAKLRRAQRAYVRLLRKGGRSSFADAIEHQALRHIGDPWDCRRVAGDFLPIVYTTLTGEKPSTYGDGPTVQFIKAALLVLGFHHYGEDAIKKAMRRYGVAARKSK